MGYFPVRYDSRVIIYERKIFIRLATVGQTSNNAESCSNSYVVCMKISLRGCNLGKGVGSNQCDQKKLTNVNKSCPK